MTLAIALWSDLVDAFDRGIVDSGKLPELLLYLGFLGSFGFIRTSAHLIRAQVRWWPGNVNVGGTHVHHLVWGICTLIITGWATIAFDPGPPVREILAALFGIGLGLALDEFALWVNLKDVYWSEKGRASIDAVMVAAGCGLVVLLGLRGLVDLGEEVADGVVLALVGNWVAGIVVAAACLLARRWLLAAVSILVPPVGIVGLAWIYVSRRRRSAAARASSTSSATSSRGSRKRSRT